jgi:hypothetical protein
MAANSWQELLCEMAYISVKRNPLFLWLKYLHTISSVTRKTHKSLEEAGLIYLSRKDGVFFDCRWDPRSLDIIILPNLDKLRDFSYMGKKSGSLQPWRFAPLE